MQKKTFTVFKAELNKQETIEFRLKVPISLKKPKVRKTIETSGSRFRDLFKRFPEFSYIVMLSTDFTLTGWLALPRIDIRISIYLGLLTSVGKTPNLLHIKLYP